jgi:polyisoprenoid-binding protein YceI
MNRNFLSGLCGFLMMAGLAQLAQADDYKADPVHSAVIFSVHHFDAGYVYGSFIGPTGTITYDADDPTKSSFDLTVNVDSLDTRQQNRDNDLKGPDFFDVKQFPTMTFKSTSVKKTSDTQLEVTGDLTLHGQTKSVTVTMDLTGTGKSPQGETRSGFETHFSINRSDYGMNYEAPAIGDEVRIIVAVEGIKQ